MTSLSPFATRVGRLDVGEARELGGVADAPLNDRGGLRVAGGEVGGGVAPLGPGEDAADELLAPVLALLRGAEEQVEDVLLALDVLHRVGAGLVDPSVHVPAALRARPGEDHPAGEVKERILVPLGD